MKTKTFTTRDGALAYLNSRKPFNNLVLTLPDQIIEITGQIRKHLMRVVDRGVCYFEYPIKDKRIDARLDLQVLWNNHQSIFSIEYNTRSPFIEIGGKKQ